MRAARGQELLGQHPPFPSVSPGSLPRQTPWSCQPGTCTIFYFLWVSTASEHQFVGDEGARGSRRPGQCTACWERLRETTRRGNGNDTLATPRVWLVMSQLAKTKLHLHSRVLSVLTFLIPRSTDLGFARGWRWLSGGSSRELLSLLLLENTSAVPRARLISRADGHHASQTHPVTQAAALRNR